LVSLSRRWRNLRTLCCCDLDLQVAGFLEVKMEDAEAEHAAAEQDLLSAAKRMQAVKASNAPAIVNVWHLNDQNLDTIVDRILNLHFFPCALHSQVAQLQHQNAQLTQTNEILRQERDDAREQATQAVATVGERDAQLATAKDFSGKLSDQLDTCARQSAQKDEVIAASQRRTAELEASLQELQTSSAATIDDLKAQLKTAINEQQHNGRQAFDAAMEAARKLFYADSTGDQPGGSSSKRQRLDVTAGETAPHACMP
jgi:hypothetical protein